MNGSLNWQGVLGVDIGQKNDNLVEKLKRVLSKAHANSLEPRVLSAPSLPVSTIGMPMDLELPSFVHC